MSHQTDIDVLLTPAEVPSSDETIDFDFVSHEYWKLGRAFQELSMWNQILKKWEADLLIRERTLYHPASYSRSSRGGRGRGRGQGQGRGRGRGRNRERVAEELE